MTPSARPYPKRRLSDQSLSDDDIDILENAFEDSIATFQAYQPPSRRPLIDFVKNEWRADSQHEPLPHWPAPRLLRSVVFLSMLLFVLWGNWQTWMRVPDDGTLRQFGLGRPPQFKNLIQVQSLDPELLPTDSNGRRLVFIGDIHGCIDEFRALLHQINHHPETDHVVLAGDVIDKGPASAAVVDLARSLQASCVRGNHEDKYLLRYAEAPIDVKRRDQTPLTLKALRVQKALVAKHRRRFGVAEVESPGEKLNEEQLEYFSRCPVILDVGTIPSFGRTHVVHAGLVPGVELAQQDPVSVMNMRTMDPQTRLPSKRHRGRPWFNTWNKVQKTSPNPAVVIYGHDSQRGLQLHSFSKGLDTACVAGGQLTALVLTSHSVNVSSVPCKSPAEHSVQR